MLECHEEKQLLPKEYALMVRTCQKDDDEEHKNNHGYRVYKWNDSKQQESWRQKGKQNDKDI